MKKLIAAVGAIAVLTALFVLLAGRGGTAPGPMRSSKDPAADLCSDHAREAVDQLRIDPIQPTDTLAPLDVPTLERASNGGTCTYSIRPGLLRLELTMFDNRVDADRKYEAIRATKPADREVEIGDRTTVFRDSSAVLELNRRVLFIDLRGTPPLLDNTGAALATFFADCWK